MFVRSAVGVCLEEAATETRFGVVRADALQLLERLVSVRGLGTPLLCHSTCLCVSLCSSLCACLSPLSLAASLFIVYDCMCLCECVSEVCHSLSLCPSLPVEPSLLASIHDGLKPMMTAADGRVSERATRLYAATVQK